VVLYCLYSVARARLQASCLRAQELNEKKNRSRERVRMTPRARMMPRVRMMPFARMTPRARN
jgi:hypothetical protein